jgi:tartrate dehydratase beta subunit/fumarate hydratase class I family protein
MHAFSFKATIARVTYPKAKHARTPRGIVISQGGFKMTAENGPTSSNRVNTDSNAVFNNHSVCLVLDYGSQYTQLIARRVRENGVLSVLLPGDASMVRHSYRCIDVSMMWLP